MLAARALARLGRPTAAPLARLARGRTLRPPSSGVPALRRALAAAPDTASTAARGAFASLLPSDVEHFRSILGDAGVLTAPEGDYEELLYYTTILYHNNIIILLIYYNKYIYIYIPYHTIPYHTIPYHTIRGAAPLQSRLDGQVARQVPLRPQAGQHAGGSK